MDTGELMFIIHFGFYYISQVSRMIVVGISTFLQLQGLLRFHRACPSTFLDTISNVVI